MKRSEKEFAIEVDGNEKVDSGMRHSMDKATEGSSIERGGLDREELEWEGYFYR